MNRLLTLAASLAWMDAASGQMIIRETFVFDTPTSPAGVVIGDFDLNSYTDIAVLTERPNELSIIENRGRGRFRGPNQQRIDARPGFAVAADFNRDLALDIAFAAPDDGTVHILLNDGDGEFSLSSIALVGANPVWIATARLDSNASPDLVVVNGDESSISVLLSNGAGAFSATTYVVGVNPVAVAIGDFDADGDEDLAVANTTDSTVSVLYNDGSGQFGVGPVLVVGAPMSPRGIAAGRVNEDGRDDLVVSVTGGGRHEVWVFAATLGGFGTPSIVPIPGLEPGVIAAPDFNGDGAADFVTLNHQSADVSVFLNSGTGSFNLAQIIEVGPDPTLMAVGDVLGNSRLDIAVTDRQTDTTWLLIGNVEPSCYPDCDPSTGLGVLDLFDFLCFQIAFISRDPYACDCDTNTGPDRCDIFDFLCFQNAFVQGCP